MQLVVSALMVSVLKEFTIHWRSDRLKSIIRTDDRNMTDVPAATWGYSPATCFPGLQLMVFHTHHL